MKRNALRLATLVLLLTIGGCRYVNESKEAFAEWMTEATLTTASRAEGPKPTRTCRFARLFAGDEARAKTKVRSC
ncbi:MAG TPA: hypothetical protein VFN10_20985 [Thermoanaerobaculia bacterium]|nr:hypothetical protein [Thermoanaerobaculia bacterium]